MAIVFHPEKTRGFQDMGWIKLYQSFNPNHPPAPNRSHFGAMVIFDNGHIMPGGKGFGMHPHRDMEIISVVVKGTMHHSDTAGHEGIGVKDSVQLISAGTGIQHSEYNHSDSEEIDNLQIWFLPRKSGLPPAYQKIESPETLRKNKLQLLAAPTNEAGNTVINNDVWLYRGSFVAGASFTYQKHLVTNGIYLYVIDGEAEAKGQKLSYRDGLGIIDEDEVKINFSRTTDILVIDIPMN